MSEKMNSANEHTCTQSTVRTEVPLVKVMSYEQYAKCIGVEQPSLSNWMNNRYIDDNTEYEYEDGEYNYDTD